MGSGREAQLYLIVCRDDEVLSLGEPQAMWLEQAGHIEKAAGLYQWRVTGGQSAEEMDALVFEQRELRQCDFCLQPAGGWLVAHEPVGLTTLGPVPGARLKKLPFICCDRCIKYVRAGDREGLTERSLDRMYAHAHRQAAELGRPIAGKAYASNVIRPQLRGVVDAMFDSMTGEPVHDA
jgi:hypothetical protein